ncbi:MAG: TRAP transporter substrate-binding protein [Hyphomicrobiaceae bacterium]
MLKPVSTAVIASALFVFFTSVAAKAADVTLRYAGTLPTSHHVTEGQMKLAERVKALTSGAVVIQVFPAGQLYGAREIPTAVATGGADMGFNLTSVWSTDPVSEITDVPFLFKDAAHAAKAWDPKGKLFQAFSKQMEKRGLKTVHVTFFGSLFDFGNNGRALKGQGDFKGMKIRSYGKLAAEGLRALGASPVTMSPGEMYLAIQRGTVDGAITGVTSLQSRKIWEVVKFATITGATFGVMATNISLSKWKSMKPEHQQALLKAGDEVFRWSVGESVKRDDAAVAFLKQKGVATLVLTSADKANWKRLFAPAIAKWNSRAGKEEKELLAWVESLAAK